MQILNETWHRKARKKSEQQLCMDQSVKLNLDQGKTSVKTGRGVGQGCRLSLILFNLCSEYLTMKAIERVGDFKIGGQVIRNEICRRTHAISYGRSGATGHD
jgi:hypothetical protein